MSKDTSLAARFLSQPRKPRHRLHRLLSMTVPQLKALQGHPLHSDLSELLPREV